MTEPLVLTVEEDGSISRIAGGPLEEPIDTAATHDEPRWDVVRGEWTVTETTEDPA